MQPRPLLGEYDLCGACHDTYGERGERGWLPNDTRPAADREFVAVCTPRAGDFALEREFRPELVLSLLVCCGAEFKDAYWPLLNASRKTLPLFYGAVEAWVGVEDAGRAHYKKTMTIIFPPAGKDRQSYPIRALAEQMERTSLKNWPPPGRLSSPRRNIRPTQPIGVFIAIYYGVNIFGFAFIARFAQYAERLPVPVWVCAGLAGATILLHLRLLHSDPGYLPQGTAQGLSVPSQGL